MYCLLTVFFCVYQVTRVLPGQSTSGESPVEKLRVTASASMQAKMHQDVLKENLLEVMSPAVGNRDVGVSAFIASANAEDLGYALCNVEDGCRQKVESMGTKGWRCTNCDTTSLSCSWQLRILVTCLHYSVLFPLVIHVYYFSFA